MSEELQELQNLKIGIGPPGSERLNYSVVSIPAYFQRAVERRQTPNAKRQTINGERERER
jgi:hypothetical protein